MKTNLVKVIAPALLLGSLLAPLAAQAGQPLFHRTINGRLHHQHARIEQGERSGRLNERQANRLKGRDLAIRRLEARDRRRHHGKLTASNRRYLNGQLNRNSHAIYRAKHKH